MSREQQVTVYVAEIRPLYEEALFKKAFLLADRERQRKAESYLTEKRRAACLAAGILADEAKRRFGCGDRPIRYTQQGQPYLETGQGQKKVWISISHSGDYAACAVGFCPVGVDIQKETAVRERIGKYFYAPGERKSPAAALERKDFFRRWTIKEAYMKLTGVGMALGFSSLFADLDSRIVYETGQRDKKACFRECRAPEGYYLSVCFAPALGGPAEKDGQGGRERNVFLPPGI